MVFTLVQDGLLIGSNFISQNGWHQLSASSFYLYARFRADKASLLNKEKKRVCIFRLEISNVPIYLKSSMSVTVTNSSRKFIIHSPRGTQRTLYLATNVLVPVMVFIISTCVNVFPVSAPESIHIQPDIFLDSSQERIFGLGKHPLAEEAQEMHTDP
ncbi:hypothetical protein M9H77_11344 [Catharanthus roseus]|uniref:Uncharacterized protein n=1 Tax=Catharanthus roseus TaxID=4058 RepID=A0ACC0BED0_CATRO|nr:hypothetical protein M9H77_11344 [Catharanthus roseus]